MRILATLDTPDSGHGWIDGFSVVDDPERVRKRLGFMPDSFGTYPNVNCEEYLDFFARAYGLKGDERRAALIKTMTFTQLDRLAEKPVNGLSKGMKQRLCLGRALIHDPSVLILDEPAAGLDPRARIELREMICRLAKDGKALLVSSHILTELAEMCDRVAIIEQGRLLAVGSVDDILCGHGHQASPQRPAVAGGHEFRFVVSSLDDPSRLLKWLSDHHQITGETVPDTKTEKNTIQFNIGPQAWDRREEKQAELLSDLIAAGFRITSFRIKEKSLEDAFLHVTRGLVQ
jgi:ABC-2 type transport system ATP-binding protein